MSAEIWKDIKGYEGLYQISNYGRVKSLGGRLDGYAKDIIMKLTPDQKGYLRVRFCKNRKKETFKIHRLVAQAFLLNPANKSQTNHKDGEKSNNYIYNLEWVTNMENKQHAMKNGLSFKGYKGSKHPLSKLIEKDILEIRKLYNENKSIKDIASIYNVTIQNIGFIVKRQTWRHV